IPNEERATSTSRWSLFLVASAVALGVGLVLPRCCDLTAFYAHAVVWFVVANIVLLALTAGDSLARLRKSWRPALVIAVACVAATTVAFVLISPAYRVLCDEPNLLSTSRSLVRSGTLFNITELAGGDVISQGVATRPGLYPSMVAALHVAFGYQPEHAFVVNFVVCAATLIVMVLLGREVAGTRLGVIAAGFVFATPLFLLCATSAGFDALNHLLFLLLVLGAIRFARAPTRCRFDRLILVAALAAQCRYESALFALLLPVCALGSMKQVLREGPGWIGALAPLCFIPTLLHVTVIGMSSQAGQSELVGHAVFSLSYVGANLRHLAELLVPVPGSPLPIALPVTLLAVFGACRAVLALRARAARARWSGPIGYAALTLFAVCILQITFRMGDLRTPHNVRLALIYVGPLALLAAYAVEGLWIRRRVVVALACTALCSVSLIRARSNELVGRLVLPRAYAKVLPALAAHARLSSLIIAERPGLYVAQGYDAVGFATYPTLAALDRDVVVIESVSAHAPASPALEVLDTISLGSNQIVRVSRVKRGASDQVPLNVGIALAESGARRKQ
ncbi:MAG TPA: hypothetical protein VIV11_15635, partial [Kofleriaceae bacterium]